MDARTDQTTHLHVLSRAIDVPEWELSNRPDHQYFKKESKRMQNKNAARRCAERSKTFMICIGRWTEKCRNQLEQHRNVNQKIENDLCRSFNNDVYPLFENDHLSTLTDIENQTDVCDDFLCFGISELQTAVDQEMIDYCSRVDIKTGIITNEDGNETLIDEPIVVNLGLFTVESCADFFVTLHHEKVKIELKFILEDNKNYQKTMRCIDCLDKKLKDPIGLSGSQKTRAKNELKDFEMYLELFKFQNEMDVELEYTKMLCLVAGKLQDALRTKSSESQSLTDTHRKIVEFKRSTEKFGGYFYGYGRLAICKYFSIYENAQLC